MKPFELRLRFPVGSVMVGGYSPTPRDVHGAHATDRHRRPLIPATALRGALREALEGILRGVGEHICSGGDGIDPEASNGTPASVECSLDNGQRCKACRLFGSRRGSIDQDEHAFSALILGDALLEGEHDVRPQTRPGVSISRNRRSAEENRLYMHHVPSTPNAYFKAEGILLDPSMEHLFQAAVRSTTHIGAGRSRGLARVEIEPPDWRELSSDNARLPTSSDVRIRVTLLSPASIGAPVVHPNLRQTRYEIPGSALRGAIGFALAAMLDNPNEDQAFQALVSEDGARFGFLYPVDNATADVAGPLPITTAACKEKKLQHGIVDTLLDRLTVAVVTDATQMERVERDIASECKICRQPLRALSGWRRRTNSVPDRLVTRVSLDRTRTSARDEFLFSQVLLDTGTTFEGLIRDVPDRGRAHLARALASHLSLGRGRSAGWGRVSIEVLEPQAALPLSQRAIEFEKALTVRFERATLATDICQRLVPITLMSPLLSTEGDGESLLSRALSAVRCLFKARRFSREGGWDQRGAGMQSTMGVSAGGVFVFELDRPWREALSKIEQLEREGVGSRRHQGYGQLMAFDPLFHRDPNEVISMESRNVVEDLRPQRKDFVIAAEGASGMLAASRLQKTQLNHLIAVCGEATCTQEIENYLRYQEARDVWPKETANQVIVPMQEVLKKHEITDDAQRVAAWRLYAVFLTRAFTYRKAQRNTQRDGQTSAHQEKRDKAR